MGDKTTVIRTPAGRVVEVPAESAEAAQSIIGSRPATPEEVTAERQRVADEEKYGGVLGGIATAIESGVSGATGGGYDLLGRALFGDKFTKVRQKQEEYHPVVSTLAETGGAIVGPMGKVAGALRGSVAARAGGGLAGAALGGGAEGVAYSVGQSGKELALSDEPITAERIVGTLSSNALLEGGIGGVTGLAGKALEKTLHKAGGAIKARASTEAGAAEEAAVDAEFAGADRATMRVHREAEVANLETARAADKEKLAQDILTMRQESKEAKSWMATDSKELRKVSLGAERQIDRLTDNVKGLAQNPRRALDALQRQEQTLERILAESGEVRATATAELAKEEAAVAARQAAEAAADRDMATRLRAQMAKGNEPNLWLDTKSSQRFGSFIDEEIPLHSGINATRRQVEDFASALESGSVPRKAIARSEAQMDLLTKKGVVKVGAQERLDALAKTERLLERNRGLQGQLEDLYKPVASERLERIDAAIDALSAPKPAPAKAGLLEQAVQGSIFGATLGALPAIPVVGSVLAPAVAAKVSGAATELLFRRAGTAAAAAGARTEKAIDTLLSFAPKAEKVAIPLSTSVLSNVRFGGEERRGPGRPKKDEVPLGQTGSALHTAFKAREKELRGQVEPGPDGKPRMTAAARTALGDKLLGFKEASPMLADRIETAAARRVEFLAMKLPRRPNFAASVLGPDTWRPSEMEMRRFARYVAAAEDPGSVEERLAAGRISPEDAEAYQAVYPERLEALKMHLLQNMPTMRKQLSYDKRLALSMMTGVPLVPALQPEILRVLQSNYANEPGTEGGVQAPTPQPAFGSISKEKPTPAQERGAL